MLAVVYPYTTDAEYEYVGTDQRNKTVALLFY